MSYKSALEIEVTKAAQRLSRYMAGCDRAVLLGLLLSATPFPPSTFLGFILDLINLTLIINGSLSRKELAVVSFSVVLSVMNACAFMFLLGFFRSEVAGVWDQALRLLMRLMSIFWSGTALAPQSPDYSLQHV